MHPALGIKPNEMVGCVYQMVSVFLRNVDAHERRDPTAKMCLVFWPTARRSRVLGVETSVVSLGAIDDLGLRRRCLEDMLDDAWGSVSSVMCNELDCYGSCFPADLDRHVNDFGDIDLVKRFWALRATVVCTDHLSLFAPTVHRAIVLFGVDALMPAFEAHLSGWKTTWVGFANGIRLVASLVGVSNEAVCLRVPLSVPHALRLPQLFAFALRLYKVLFSNPSPPQDWEKDGLNQLMQAALVDAVRLESYLWDDPMHGTMLPELNKLVYAYRLPPHMEALVINDIDIVFYPWTVLAPVVLALAPTRVPWCDALLRATATSCEVEPFDLDVEVTGDE